MSTVIRNDRGALEVRVNGRVMPAQPTEFVWADPVELGRSGTGAPVFGALQGIVLRFGGEMSSEHYSEWYNLRGKNVDMTLPHPATGQLFDAKDTVVDRVKGVMDGGWVTRVEVELKAFPIDPK